MIESFKKIGNIPTAPGAEGDLLSYIEDTFGDCEVSKDGMGNLCLKRSSGAENAKKLMFCTSVDDSGLIVNYIEENGFLRVTALGSVNAVSAAYREVLIDGSVSGLVVPEKGADIKGGDLSKLYVDIGARDREEAESYVALGDVCSFIPSIRELAFGRYGGFGVASRACVAVLLSVLRDFKSEDTDLYVCFTVQGSLRARGAKVAAFDIEPDLCISVEPIESFDTIGAVRRGEAVLGDGAVVISKTSDYIANPAARKVLESLSGYGKTCVYPEKTSLSALLSRCGKGIPCVCVGIPARNIGSGAEVVLAEDACRTVELLTGIRSLESGIWN